MHKAPEGFKHATPITIRFADLDAMGHVNNAKYLTYVETARMNYVHEVCHVMDMLNPGMILAKLTIEYKQPLMLGDDIVVYTRCSRLGTKSFDLEALIVRCNGDRVEHAASTLAVLVAYDYRASQTITVPDTWREQITTYEPVPVG